MALTYRVEYRLGSREACVTRTYGGIRALIAIAVGWMLALVFGVFGLAFGVVGWTLWLAWNLGRLVVIALRDVVVALARFVRAVLTLPWQAGRREPAALAAKPSWAGFEEL